MKKYLSVLMSMLLVLSLMPAFMAATLAYDKDADGIYYQDYNNENITSEEISAFIRSINTAQYSATSVYDAETGNGYLHLNALSGATARTIKLGADFNCTNDKRDIVLEYRFRYGGLLGTTSKNLYINNEPTSYDGAGYVDFKTTGNVMAYKDTEPAIVEASFPANGQL